jgi:hypothetical protein
MIFSKNICQIVYWALAWQVKIINFGTKFLISKDAILITIATSLKFLEVDIKNQHVITIKFSSLRDLTFRPPFPSLEYKIMRLKFLRLLTTISMNSIFIVFSFFISQTTEIT